MFYCHVSEALNLCIVWGENPPVCFDLNAPILLENKISRVLDLRCVNTISSFHYSSLLHPEARVLVRKLRQLTLLSYAKRANPKNFIMLCGISCELAGYVHRPIVDSESMIAG